MYYAGYGAYHPCKDAPKLDVSQTLLDEISAENIAGLLK